MSTTEDHNQQWSKYTDAYHASVWLKDVLEIPFLEAQFKRFTEKKGERGPWRALDVGCGMGKYTVRLLQAGASYVLASDSATDMVAGAKKETEQYLISQSELRTRSSKSSADFVTCSAAELTSIPGIQEASFDLAICIYVLCNLPSKQDVQQALLAIWKLLKPGGKFMFYEPHVVEYVTANSAGHVEYLPKEDGMDYKYFQDEGKPRTLRLHMGSGSPIEITNRFYTLSFWVASLVETGFQITRFYEPHINPEDVPSDSPGYMTYYAEQPSTMFWECTKVLQ